MPITSAAALVAILRQHRLLDAAQLNELARDLQPRFPEPRALARELLQRTWLTSFQLNRLFQDRCQELVLGSYVFLEPLGEGGMGTVYKARHQRLERIDAVKVIRKNLLSDAGAVERFQREARAAARLAHPNVVTVYDANEINGVHFLAMEYVAGVDLSRLVKERGPLPVDRACDYIRQAGLGLQHAHEKGLVHRDVKPSNLLLTQESHGSQPLGLIKILDLGLARLIPLRPDAAGESLTTTGSIVGTPDYIAPEQARNAHTIDIRADVYSLGCTLYFLLTGRVPHPGETLTEKLLKHQLEEPQALEQLRPDVPTNVTAALHRMMAKRPEDRFQLPAEVAAALRAPVPMAAVVAAAPMAVALQSAVPGPLPTRAIEPWEPVELSNDWAEATPTGSQTVPLGVRLAHTRRWLPWVAAAAAGSFLLLVLLIVGAVGVLMHRGTPDPSTFASGGSGPPPGGRDPQARAHVERGKNHYEAKRYDQAITEFTEAIRLDPTDANAYFSRASAYYAKGQYDKALADNSKVIQLKPDYAPAYNNRGTLYGLQGKPDRAISDFTEAIRLAPTYADAYANRGRAYMDRRDHERAIMDLSDAIRLQPATAGHYNDRGVAYLRKGEYDKAIADLDRAIQLDGKLAMAYLNRSRVHARKGNQAAAQADERKAVELDPSLGKGR